MSLKHGMAALNLEMSDRVPRTEYSVETHWEVVKKVTGLPVKASSDAGLKAVAKREFYKKWNYDFMWNVLIQASFLGDYHTDMGHAVFEAGGTDFRQTGVNIFEDPEDVLSFDPVAKLPHYEIDELVKHFNADYEMRCAISPDAVNMSGIYISAMSGLIDMLGWDSLLLAAGVDSDEFGALIGRYTDWSLNFFKALAKSNSEVVMVHDDIVWTSGAMIDPEWYRKYLFPCYNKLFAPLIEAGKKIVYTSDGDFTQFIDDIAACNINGFVMEPMTDMEYIAKKYGKTHAFVGNADTRVLLMGDKQDIKNEVKRCMDIGKNCPGFIMAVGNHIPANTPLDNVLWYNEFYEELSKR